MGFGGTVPEFTAGMVADAAAVPGVRYPLVGTHGRVCKHECVTAECAKRTVEHKGGCDAAAIEGIDKSPLYAALDLRHNQDVDSVRALQGLAKFLDLGLNGVPRYTSTQTKINGDTEIWIEKTDISLTSGTAYTLSGTCDFDPASVQFRDGENYNLNGPGVLITSGSRLSTTAKFIIKGVTSTAAVNGRWGITFHSLTNVPDEFWAGGTTILATFRRLDSEEQWTSTKHIDNFYSEPHAPITITDLVQGDNIVLAGVPCLPVDPPLQTVEKQVDGVWSAWTGVAVKNRSNGGTGWDTVLPLAGVTITGIMAARCTFYAQVVPTATQFAQATLDIAETSQSIFMLEENATLYGDQWSVTAAYDDADHDVPGALIFQDGADIKLDLTGVDPFTYETTSGGDPVEMPYTLMTCTYNHVTAVATHQSADVYCDIRCKHSKEIPNGLGGVLDTVANRHYYCDRWNFTDPDPEIPAAIKASYVTHMGRCLHQDCPHFEIERNNHASPFSAIPPLIGSRKFCQEQQQENDANSFIFTTQRGHPSLLSLSGTAQQAEAGNYKRRLWNWGGEAGQNVAFGRVVHTEYLAYTYETEEGDPPETVTHNVFLSTSSLEHGLEFIDGTDRQGLASQVPLTRGQTGIHLHENTVDGQLRTLTSEASCLLFPLVNLASTDWQEFTDGRLKLGYWDADGNELPDSTGATGLMAIQLVDGRRPIKLPGDTHAPEPVTTVTVHSAVSSGTTYKLALKHKRMLMYKPNGTTNPDQYVSVLMPGSNVLLPNSKRPSNAACPASMIGAGASGSFIRSGTDLPSPRQCLKTPNDARLPLRLREKLLPIIAATANDEDETTGQVTDEAYLSWDGNLQYLENAYSPPTVTHPEWCDTIVVANEGGILAAISALGLLDALTFEVVEAPYATALTAAAIEGPANGSQALTATVSLPSSGLFIFSARPTEARPCVVLDLDQISFGRWWNAHDDLNPVVATFGRLWSE